jgi:carnosine N-methyltransferase
MSQHEQDVDHSEQLHLINVLTAFAYYKRYALNHNHRRRRDYLSLAEHHKQLIPNYLDKINQVDERIEENMKLIRDIVASASMFLDQPMTQVKCFYAFHTRHA